MRIIGIDPGQTGAIGVLERTSGALVALADLPIIVKDKLSWVDGGELRSFLLEHRGSDGHVAVVEHVHSMPKQGVASSFKFGVLFGSILSVIQALEIPLVLVRSNVWKREQQLAGKEKDQSISAARLAWPAAELTLKKHHGRAEALLIADWYRTNRGEHG